MNNIKIMIVTIIINVLIIGFLSLLISNIYIDNEYTNINQYPDPIFSIEGKNPYLFITQNEDLILVYSNFDKNQEQEINGSDIFLIRFKNNTNYEEIIQITNDKNSNIFPKLVQNENSTYRLYYYSKISKEIRNWIYIESDNLRNWTKPIICDNPLTNQYWSEINNPPFFNNAKKNYEFYSLIKNYKEEYLIAGIHDTSSSDCKIYHLFIIISDNGKDWDLPIRIGKNDNYEPFVSLIENEPGSYFLAYQYLDNFNEKIDIIKFSDSDLRNINEPEKNYNMQYILFIIFCLGIILIFDIFIIKYLLKKKAENSNEFKNK